MKKLLIPIIAIVAAWFLFFKKGKPNRRSGRRERGYQKLGRKASNMRYAYKSTRGTKGFMNRFRRMRSGQY